MIRVRAVACAALVGAALLTSCSREEARKEKAAASAAPITNRIAVPPEVVENLGITFAPVERGRVEETLVVPGLVDVPPEHRRNVVAPAAGRIRLSARLWQRVAAGDVLGELSTPALGEARRAVVAADAEREAAETELREEQARSRHAPELASVLGAAAEAARARTATARAAAEDAKALETKAAERAKSFEALAANAAASRAEIVDVRRDVAEARRAAVDADRAAHEANVDAARLAMEAGVATARAEGTANRLAVLERRVAAARADATESLRSLAALVGSTVEELSDVDDGRPGWLTLSVVALRAPGAGVVTDVAAADGEWVDGGAPVVRIADTTQLAFVGQMPEGDLARVPKGARVHVRLAGAVSAKPIEVLLPESLPVADPTTRAVRLVLALPVGAGQVPAGTSATAEIVLGTSAQDELLVPAAAVVRDDLETVVFKRDAADAGKVIRTAVSVGRRSSDKVEVLAGVSEGDTVVVRGVHQLKQTGIGKAPAGGHFHADGTWHEGDE